MPYNSVQVTKETSTHALNDNPRCVPVQYTNNAHVISWAAMSGFLPLVEELWRRNRFLASDPVQFKVMVYRMAGHGHLHMLQWHQHQFDQPRVCYDDCVMVSFENPWDKLMDLPASRGHLNVLQWFYHRSKSHHLFNYKCPLVTLKTLEEHS